MKKDVQRGELWPEFSFPETPTLIIDNSYDPYCGYFMQEAQLIDVVRFTRSSSERGRNFTYYPNPDFYPNPPRGFSSLALVLPGGHITCCNSLGDLEVELATYVKKRKWPAVYVHWLTSARGGLSDSYEGIGQAYGLMNHEAFHFFYQNRFLSNKPWPNKELVASATSDEMKKKCYEKSPQIFSILKAEVELLLKVALHPSRNAIEIREFVNKRQTRYQIADKNCQSLEASYEYGEGVPQFLMYAQELLNGSISREKLVARVRRDVEFNFSQGSAGATLYYHTGALQLLVLFDQLGPQEFKRIIKNLMAQSKETPLHQVLHF